MIGRIKERRELENLYNSPKAEFVAIYGRRRVGKTYLVSQTFKNRITFEHTGLSDPADGMKDQLKQFYFSLLRQGMKQSHIPSDWLEAFFMLEMFLKKKAKMKESSSSLTNCPGLIRRVRVSSLHLKDSGTTGAAGRTISS